MFIRRFFYRFHSSARCEKARAIVRDQCAPSGGGTKEISVKPFNGTKISVAEMLTHSLKGFGGVVYDHSFLRDGIIASMWGDVLEARASNDRRWANVLRASRACGDVRTAAFSAPLTTGDKEIISLPQSPDHLYDCVDRGENVRVPGVVAVIQASESGMLLRYRLDEPYCILLYSEGVFTEELNVFFTGHSGERSLSGSGCAILVPMEMASRVRGVITNVVQPSWNRYLVTGAHRVAQHALEDILSSSFETDGGIVVLAWVGTIQENDLGARFSMTIGCTDEMRLVAVKSLTNFIEVIRGKMDGEELRDAHRVIEEALCNAIEHGSGLDKHRNIHIQAWVSKDENFVNTRILIGDTRIQMRHGISTHPFRVTGMGGHGENQTADIGATIQRSGAQTLLVFQDERSG